MFGKNKNNKFEEDMKMMKEEIEYWKNKVEGGKEMPRRNYEPEDDDIDDDEIPVPATKKEMRKTQSAPVTTAIEDGVKREPKEVPAQQEQTQINPQEILDAIDGHLLRASNLLRLIRQG